MRGGAGEVEYPVDLEIERSDWEEVDVLGKGNAALMAVSDRFGRVH